MNVKSANNIYQSPLLKKGLKFASEHSAIFTTGATFALGAVARPISIMLSPSAKKEDKKISAINSISSSLAGFAFTALFALPLAYGVKKIDANPSKYLNDKTIKNLSQGAKSLQDSKSYQFLTQIFKLGLGFLLAYPKALVKNELTPRLSALSAVIARRGQKNNNEKTTKDKSDEAISLKSNQQTFKGSENFISKVINNPTAQGVAKKMQNTNFITGMVCLSDIFATASFIDITNKNKKLNDREKKVLNLNSAISTGLCLTLGTAIDRAFDKPTEKFISNIKKYNPNSPDLAKYATGAKIAKTTAIFGGIYYCLIPMLSTAISSKLANKQEKTL